MPTSDSGAITSLLRECGTGGRDSMEKLVPLLYDELRSLADNQLRKERSGHTLQPTALVHEAFLKLVVETERKWQNRAHFFRAAATAMRRILVNHALARKTAKRGGAAEKVPLDEALATFEERAIDLIALNEALERLEQLDPERAELVELRFFAGLSADETAELLGVSTRTVERQWRTARSWLRKEIDGA